MAYVEYRMGGGLNLRTADDAVQDDELTSAVGADLYYPGQVRSELGSVQDASNINAGSITSTWLDSVTGITEGYVDGTLYTFVQNYGKWSYRAFGTGNFTALSYPTLPSLDTLSGFDYRGFMYFANGVNFRRWRKANFISAAEPSAAGSGYQVAESLTVSGGTGTAAVLVILEVDGSGGILNVAVDSGGDYTALPSSPFSVTGGSGSNATFTFSSTTGIEKVGCQQPDPASVSGESGVGASVAGNKYRWKVTFFNGIAESNLSEKMAQYTVVGNNKNIDITIPVDSQTNSGTIERRIYRTDNNGEAYFFVGRVCDNTTTTFSDPMGTPPDADDEASEGDEISNEQTINARLRSLQGNYKHRIRRKSGTWADYFADDRTTKKNEIVPTNLGWLCDWTDHDQAQDGAPGSIRNLILVNETVYAIYKHNRLVWMDVGNPEHYDLFRDIEIGRGYRNNKGEVLKVIQEMDKDIICYTTHGIWRFRNVGNDPFQARLEEIRDGQGTPSQQGVAVTDKWGHIFINERGVYRYDGRQVDKISDTIDQLFTDTSNTRYVDPDLLESAAVIARDDQVWISYRTTGDTVNSLTLRLDMRDGRPKWSVSDEWFSSGYVTSERTITVGRRSEIRTYEESPGLTGSVLFDVTTKYFPVRSALSGEQPYAVWLDVDTQGVDMTAELLDEDGTVIMTWTVNTSDRDKVKKLVPFGDIYERLAVRLYSTDYQIRKLYGVAFETDEGALNS